MVTGEMDAVSLFAQSKNQLKWQLDIVQDTQADAPDDSWSSVPPPPAGT